MADKLAQHAPLVAALRADGWTIVEPHVIVLGACGAVYASGKEALQRLGLPPTRALAVLQELHFLAVQALHDISCARRRLERTLGKAGVG